MQRKSRSKLTPTQRVARTPRPELEMAWVKSRFGEFRPVAKKRFEHMVQMKPLRKKDRTLIHTHPFQKDWRHTTALPSTRDLNFMVRQLRKGPFRMYFIASRDPKGNVKGWTAFRPTKKLVELVRDNTRLRRDWPIFSIVSGFKTRKDIQFALMADTLGAGVNRTILRFLLDEKLVQLRFFPAKGKVYQPQYQRFESKKRAAYMSVTARDPFP